MGFPDNYTNLVGAKKTSRYQGTGNSWAVPVVKWIGERLILGTADEITLDKNDILLSSRIIKTDDEELFFNFGKDVIPLSDGASLNCTAIPEKCSFTSMKEIVSPDAPDDIYISSVGCYGIVRRKMERNLKINPRLEEVLLFISSEVAPEEIEKRSRIQQRRRFSTPNEVDIRVADEPVLDILSKSITEKKRSKSDTVDSIFSSVDPEKLPEGRLSLLDFM